MADSANGRSSQEGQKQSMLASQRAKEAGEKQPRSAYFPMGYKEGFSQWWASISPAAAEHKVLSFVPYLQAAAPSQSRTGTVAPSATQSTSDHDDLSRSVSATKETGSSTDPYGPRRWHSSLVKLAGKNRALNEFSIERVDEPPADNHLVMLHGYGAGLGFFYKNFEPLSRLPNWNLYALDLLGMGRSSRPQFRIHAKDREGKIAEAESWFIDSLEEWRVSKGIDRFTLLGHSLGGYMAVAYALKYPGHLNKLILASPVGIPEDPYAVSAEMPEPDESTMNNEFSQEQPENASAAKKGDQNNFLNAKSKAPSTNKPNQPPRRKLPKWLTYLWDANISPFSLVRWSGPLGPRLVSGWTSRRFSQMPPEEAQALHDYAYSLFRQRGSGEYALAYILAPGAFARSPLIRRIGGIGRSIVKPDASKLVNGEAATAVGTRETGLPVVLMYGDKDWMDVNGGRAAVELMTEATLAAKEQRRTEEAAEGPREASSAGDAGSAKLLVVKEAGHHVYLDGWEEFNQLMKVEMEETAKSERRRRERSR
ncbi:MAG: hypothetical protein M1828_002031 [Chrysothrix sp. TS-e1954]|nr:MAG: hypothetical protein M1828_002031 [Chrysothrix sp. TS-e1954]